MKVRLLSFLLFLSLTNLFASSPHVEAISSFMKAGDTASVYKEFSKWQQEEPNSPNIADTWAYYYYGIGYNQNIKIDSFVPVGVEDYMAVIGQNGKSDFVYAEIVINCDSIQKGLDIVDRAIEKHPDCLDLYLTKGEILLSLMQVCSHKSSVNDNLDLVTASSSNEDRLQRLMMKALAHPTMLGDKTTVSNLPQKVAAQYVALLNRSKQNGNDWFDLFDKKYLKGEEKMLEGLQSTFLTLYQSAEYDVASSMNDAFLEQYPKRYDFRTNRGLIAVSKKDFFSALIHFKTLHKEFPNDEIITMNLAEIYYKLGKKKESAQLFKTLKKSSNENISNVAKARLEKLK